MQRKRWQWVGISAARMTSTVECALTTASTMAMVTSHSRRPTDGSEGVKGMCWTLTRDKKSNYKQLKLLRPVTPRVTNGRHLRCAPDVTNQKLLRILLPANLLEPKPILKFGRLHALVASFPRKTHFAMRQVCAAPIDKKAMKPTPGPLETRGFKASMGLACLRSSR